MDDKVVIDCIGPSVLTITISGATHSVPLATNVIRIGGPGGGAEYDLDALPLIYDAGTLGGRLNICDGSGKMVYCWRSLVRLQSRSSAPVQGRADHSSSSPLGPVPRIEMNTLESSSAATSSSELGDHRSNSKRKGDTSRMSAEAHTAKLKTYGNLNHDMTDCRESSSSDTLEKYPQKHESSPSESLVLRFKRHLEELKRRSDWAKLLECILCQRCIDEPKDPVVFNCFHVSCKKCLTRLQYEAAERDQHEVTCQECEEVITETQSCEGLEELRRDNLCDVLSKVGGQAGEKDSRKIAERYIDLEDEDTAPGFTVAERGFLVNSINKLLKLSYSTNSDHLRAMRRKLYDGLYTSVKALKADLDRMEHSSMMENGPNHEQTEQARSLRVAFKTYMTEYPRHGEEFTPRKKVKTTGPKTSPPAKPARAKASSPPRAAKTAMQGQKYPRDHW